LSVAAGEDMSAPDLSVEVHWVSPCCDLEPALGCGPLLVQGSTTGPAAANAWKTTVAYTEAAPPGVEFARICLRTCGGPSCSYLLVDDCQFVDEG
jgi:hypothetical protein